MILSCSLPNRNRNRQAPSQCLQKLLTKPSIEPALSGTIQPSGRFTLGFVPRKKLAHVSLTDDKCRDTWDDDAVRLQDFSTGVITKYKLDESLSPPRFIDAHYLGKPTRKPRGTHGLTAYGKRYVRESCYILETKYGVRRLGFYTLTLPAISNYEAWEVAINWGKIYKYFFKLLRNEITSISDAPLFYVGVTENQAERSSRDGCPYYHIHFVMPAYVPNTCEFLVSADTLRALWKRALSNYVPTLASLEYSASVDSQILTKSASGYLSKYFSKGADVSELPPLCLPSSWYFSSREMKKEYTRQCTPLDTVNCRLIIDNLHDTSICIFWGYVSTVSDIDGREVIRGYYGRLTTEYRRVAFSQ